MSFVQKFTLRSTRFFILEKLSSHAESIEKQELLCKCIRLIVSISIYADIERVYCLKKKIDILPVIDSEFPEAQSLVRPLFNWRNYSTPLSVILGQSEMLSFLRLN